MRAITIYVVMRVKGNYSDAEFAPLVAYTNKETAEWHATQAQNMVDQLKRMLKADSASRVGLKEMPVGELDPETTVDYMDSVEYYVVETILLEKVASS